MSIANNPAVADYKTLGNQLMYWIYKNGGIDRYGLPIFCQIDEGDFKQVLSDFYAYLPTRDGQEGTGVPYYNGRTTTNPLYPANGTTQWNGQTAVAT